MKRTMAVVGALAALLLLVMSSPSAVAQSADDPGQVAAGKVIFEASCAGCHGVDGTGATGPGRDLTGIASQGDRARHVASITEGRGTMPAFGEQLSMDEIDQAATYVRLTFVAAAEPATTTETEAATTTAAGETELALTGANSNGLAVVGATMLAAGSGLVAWSRRRD